MRLSDLRTDYVYSLVAEGVEATLTVSIKGKQPICMLQGQIPGVLKPNDPPKQFKLIGWALINPNTPPQKSVKVKNSEQPSQDCFLVGLEIPSKGLLQRPITLARSPEFL